MSSSPRRVLLADHTGKLAPALARCEVRAAHDVAGVLRLARAHRPAAVVVHAGFPPEGGISLLTRLAPLELPCVLAVDDADVRVLAAALRGGARTVVGVGAGPAGMERALEAAVRGELLLGPGIAGELPGLVAAQGAGHQPFPQLSLREQDVLAQLASGVDAGRIAARLGISPKTVRNQLARIQAKLGAEDRSEAALLARGAGLGRHRPGQGL